MTERKRAIITGASSGVGRAAAVRFAAEGWDVCLTARRANELQQLLGELPPGEHLVCPGDYGQESTAQTIAGAVAEHWGGLDALDQLRGDLRPGSFHRHTAGRIPPRVRDHGQRRALPDARGRAASCGTAAASST